MMNKLEEAVRISNATRLKVVALDIMSAHLNLPENTGRFTVAEFKISYRGCIAALKRNSKETGCRIKSYGNLAAGTHTWLETDTGIKISEETIKDILADCWSSGVRFWDDGSKSSERDMWGQNPYMIVKSEKDFRELFDAEVRND